MAVQGASWPGGAELQTATRDSSRLAQRLNRQAARLACSELVVRKPCLWQEVQQRTVPAQTAAHVRRGGAPPADAPAAPAAGPAARWTARQSPPAGPAVPPHSAAQSVMSLWVCKGVALLLGR